MNRSIVENYILHLPGAERHYPFAKDVAVFKINDSTGADKMFALLFESKVPIQLSLKCDPQLSQTLRQKYEEVMAGDHLNKKYWNTIVLSGQLEWEEIQGLIRHSYELVSSESED